MSTPKFKALVIDDDAISRKTVGFNLELEGFHCEYSDGAEDALTRLAAEEFDLIVTDLCMPHKHGHSLAVEILSMPSRPLVVAHSGIEDPRMTRELISLGVDDVIYKPTNYAGFAAKVFIWAVRRRAALKGTVNKCPTVHENGLSGARSASIAAVDMFFSATSDADAVASIAEKVKLDTVMSGAVLEFANHPDRNSTGKQITDVKLALTRVGMKKLADLALDQLRTKPVVVE